MFCSTGVFQVLIVQYLDYHGIQGGDTGLGVLSSYLGLLLFAMPFMFDENDRRPRYHKMFIPTVVCDLLGQICAQVSIQMCGSGLFMVIYSSITVFAALFRWYVYGKSLSQGQWSGIFIISLGLMVTALGGKAEEGAGGIDEDPSELQSQEMSNVVFGMVLALSSAVFYGWVYVLTEQIMKGNLDGLTGGLAPSPIGLATFSGFSGTVLTGLYMTVWIGPRWDELVTAPMTAAKGSYGTCVAMYFLLLFMCGLHNISIIYVGKSGGGAVATGVNKAVQTVSVFVASAIFYGADHLEQQFTFEKGFGVFLVVGGVLAYSYHSTTTEVRDHEERAANVEAPMVEMMSKVVEKGTAASNSISRRIGAVVVGRLAGEQKGKYKKLSTADEGDCIGDEDDQAV